jgi:hypothetical protein
MNRETLRKAMDEARRFLSIADDAIVALSQNDGSNKQTGAVKRASMDLSRALSDMRRAG